MAKNVSQQIVELLEKAGVKRVYAVTGDSLNFFNIAVKESKEIDWVHVRHEEVGAFAATAESELEGIGCLVLVTFILLMGFTKHTSQERH